MTIIGLNQLDLEESNIIRDLIHESRLPSPESSAEITAIEKAEEEVIELLASLRFLKNHYSPVNSVRKGYAEETRLHAVKEIIDEIGDIIVDAAYALSVIIPDISIPKINARVKSKIDKYRKVSETIGVS
jgi:hypothetical protein